MQMSTLPEHFDEFLSRIEPKEERAKTAQEIPDQVRDFLHDSDDIKTVEPHSRLAGSYVSDTIK
jgi:tRNA nucleotidyltransferase (CCA-adding enzyme)